MSGGLVLFFARQWDAGPVKTRLAARIGAAHATAVYRRLAERVWQGLEHPELRRWLLIEPPEACAAAAAWLPGAQRVLGQGPGDLGERMQRAFRTAFDAGCERVAVVGSDAPALDARRTLEALDALESAEVVLVPSVDGGYALLALARPAPELFRAIAWSGPEVCAQTRARAEEVGLRWTELEPVRDLDTEEDLEALRRAGWSFED